MSDVAWQVSELHAAGGAAARVASGVGTIDFGSPCADVAAALPGSRSAQAGAAAAGQWRATMTDVAGRTGRYGRNLAASADLYEQTENTIAARMASLDSAGGSVIATGSVGTAAQATTYSSIQEALG